MKELLLAIGATLLAGGAMAEDIDRTLDADADARISVSNLAGSVEVRAWDRNEVNVSGELGDDVEKLVFERDGRDIIIKVKAPDSSWGRRDVEADLDIRVPQGSSLEIGTVSADIEIVGVRGEQELHSVSGDIVTEAFAADIQAETVSGDVDIKTAADGSKGRWGISTVSGDITATGLAGEIDIETVSGDIRIDGGAYDSADIESVSGDITFNAGLAKGGELGIETVNGDLDVEFTGAVSARFQIETFNGAIRNCFGPKPERTNKYAPGLELDFTEGDGAGRVSVSTLNGDLRLCKK
ncbi:MAG TPA: DUF4097 family beta strand repeat-containing protein [Woeseiaceae bacterium]|nr:DUF4097 family beta strand repeat-containing protein [Woeseiaceae bacterium]